MYIVVQWVMSQTGVMLYVGVTRLRSASGSSQGVMLCAVSEWQSRKHTFGTGKWSVLKVLWQ